MEFSLIIGNIFALLSVIFTFISVIKKNKADLIGWQIVTILFCILSGIALAAYAALVTNLISLARNVLACKNKLTPKITFILSFLCVIIGWYINNLGLIGWMAILASVSYTVLMCLARNAQQMRYAVIFSSVLWLVHDYYVQSYPTVLSGTLLIIWTTIQIFKHRKIRSHKRRSHKKYCRYLKKCPRLK